MRFESFFNRKLIIFTLTLLLISSLLVKTGADLDYYQEEEFNITEYTFGGDGIDQGYDLIRTNDGGYVITGVFYTLSTTRDLLLAKIDKDGNLEWSRTYGGESYESGRSIFQTIDKGYLVIGTTSSYGAGNSDLWVLKTDSMGVMEWAKTYGGKNSEQAEDAILADDGNYVLISSTFSYGGGGQEIWLLKIDYNGNVLENHTFGGIGDEEPRGIIQTKDGGYAIAAYTRPIGLEGDRDFLFLYLFPNGSINWSKTYGGVKEDEAWGICELNSGEFVLAGRSGGSTIFDIWVVKTDNLGSIIWNKTFGGGGNDEPRDIIVTSDGGLLIAAQTTSYGEGESDIWLIKLDFNGISEWNLTIGGQDNDYISCIYQLSNDSFIFVGSRYYNVLLAQVNVNTITNTTTSTNQINPNLILTFLENISLAELFILNLMAIPIGISIALIYENIKKYTGNNRKS